MKILCRVGFHNWGLWGISQKGYMRAVQHRFCKDCGRQQDRDFYAEQTLPKEELYKSTVKSGGEE